MATQKKSSDGGSRGASTEGPSRHGLTETDGEIGSETGTQERRGGEEEPQRQMPGSDGQSGHGGALGAPDQADNREGAGNTDVEPQG